MTRLQFVFSQYQSAVGRLAAVLQKPKDEYTRDSAIKRFEIAFDLAWKTVKAWLEEQAGVSCASPKGCFREAYRQGLIEHDDFRLELTDLRNRCAHTYQEELAENIYAALPQALNRFQDLAFRIGRAN